MPVNKRKALGEKDRGNYPRQKLINAVLEVIDGKLASSADAQKKYQVPARTIRRWVKRGRDAIKELTPEELQVFEMRDYYGPDRGLCRDDEDLIKYFIEEAARIGIPRCRARCAVDIQEHVKQQRLDVPFTNDKPGPSYFNRFCSDVDGWPIEMMSALEVNSFMDREIDLYEWILQVREYVKEKQASLISHRRLVFIIESQTFKTATHPSRDLTVMVIYNGLGEIVRWIVVTDGTQLSDDFVLQYGPDVLLLKTENGQMTSVTVKSLMVLIKREMSRLEMIGSSLVYMDPFVSQNVNFIVWNYCNSVDILVMAIPRKLFWSMKPFRLGAMAKYAVKMLFFMYHSVVLRKSAVKGDVPAESSRDSGGPLPNGATISTEPVPKKRRQKGKVKGRSSTQGMQAVPSQGVETFTDDVIMLHEDIGTQTIETHFVQEQLHSMIKYMMTTIRTEDFKTEYN